MSNERNADMVARLIGSLTGVKVDVEPAQETIDHRFRGSIVGGDVEVDPNIDALTRKDLQDLLPNLSPRMNLKDLTTQRLAEGIMG